MHTLKRRLAITLTSAVAVFMAAAPAVVSAQAIIKHLATSSLADKELTRESFDLSELNDAKTLARTGDVESQYKVAILNHMRGAYGQAISWYRRAALFRHPLASYNLGLMYYQGEGVDVDYHEAARWFEVSAGAGYPEAAFQLGLMHYRGEGVPKDNQLEAQWYRKAALGGNAEAQYNLAVLYSKGEGVKDDPVEGLAWLELAVAGGVDADDQLADMRSSLSQQQRQAAAGLRSQLESQIKIPRFLAAQ